MQFQIPQFIEIEEKIAGPFSLRQLLYVIGGSVVAFLAFSSLPFVAAVLIALISIGGSLALALIKINGQPLTRVAFAAAGFFWKPRLYLWKREVKERVFEMPEFAGLEEISSKAEKPVEAAYKKEKEALGEMTVIGTWPAKGGEQEPEMPIVGHIDAAEREAIIRQRALERSVAIQKEMAEGPTKKKPLSDEHIMDQRNMLKKFAAGMPSINKLAGDLNTTKNPIPQREKAVPVAVAEKFNMFRKKTGEQQVAKRVDFR